MARGLQAQLGTPRRVPADKFEPVLKLDRGWSSWMHRSVVLRPLLWVKQALVPYLVVATLMFMTFSFAMYFPYFYLSTQILPAWGGTLWRRVHGPASHTSSFTTLLAMFEFGWEPYYVFSGDELPPGGTEKALTISNHVRGEPRRRGAGRGEFDGSVGGSG